MSSLSADIYAPKEGENFVDLHSEIADEIKVIITTLEKSGVKVDKLKTGYLRLFTDRPSWLVNQIRLSYLANYNFSSWYPKFEAKKEKQVINLIPEDLQSDLTELCEYNAKKEEEKHGEAPSGREEDKEFEYDIIKIWAANLIDWMTPLFETGDSYFVRMDTRSPKDSDFFGKPVKTAEECLELLTTSDRVYFDLLEFQESIVEETRKASLVILPWNPKLSDINDLELNFKSSGINSIEFRCFIHNNFLTAISQYHTGICFSLLQESKWVEKAREVILNYWISIKEKIPYRNCTLDVAVDFKSLSVTLIEFNPFFQWTETDSACFNWSADRAILLGITSEGDPSKIPVRVVKQIRRKSFS